MKQFAGYKIDQDKSQSYRQFKQPEKLLPAIELVDASDTTFMTRLGVGDDMFVEFSATQDTINKYGKWKWLIDNDHHDYFNTKLLQGRLNSSKDKNWFAISGIAKDYIELLDKKTGKIVSIRGPLNENPEYSIEVVSGHSMPIFNNKLKTKYPQTFLGEKSIFALFFGKPNFEVFGNKYAQINIFEFDFEGNPINNFVINFPVLSFTVNEDLRKIYGISLDNEPNIIEFNY